MQLARVYSLWWWCAAGAQAALQYAGPLERHHDPRLYTPAPQNAQIIVDTLYTVPDPRFTPDFRFPELPRYPTLKPKAFFSASSNPKPYYEYNRPYRLSPYYPILFMWKNYFRSPKYNFKRENPEDFCCYCTTVFKQTNVLATCAVLTTRHVLTTASSTEMVLKLYPNRQTLQGLLGAWYEAATWKTTNSSFYMTPARIHYHPQYLGLDAVNLSHPLPLHDFAVWASTFRFFGTPYQRFMNKAWTCYCNRADSHRTETISGTPKPGDEFWMIGFQWIRAYNKRPSPFFRYGLRTRDIVSPCPKLEWGWHFCLGGRWAPLGVESGAILHRVTNPKYRMIYSGLLGMAGFSMKLRSKRLTHYFQVVNTHPVLEFMSDAYNGRLRHVFLDHRFYDTKDKSPRVKPWFYVPWEYPTPNTETYYSYLTYGGWYDIY